MVEKIRLQDTNEKLNGLKLSEIWEKFLEEILEPEIRSHPSRFYRLRLFLTQDWFKNRWRRFVIAFFLWGLQALYFPINRIAKGERNMSIPAIDGRMPRVSAFIVPYAVGFIYLGISNYVAALLLNRKNFQGHVIAMLPATLIGFAFWLFYPAKVPKKRFVPRPNHLFDQWLDSVQRNDGLYGQHNSFPSSHVYYVAIGIHYLAKQYPRYQWFFDTSSVINAASTMLTHQHYFADVASGYLLSYVATWLSDNKLTPALQAWEQEKGYIEEETWNNARTTNTTI